MFALCVTSYRMDKEKIIAPVTTFQLIASIMAILMGLIMTFAGGSFRKYGDDDSYEKQENRKMDARKEKEEGWLKEREEGRLRLGKSLQLRKDLYSWSFLICYHRNYLAQVAFLG